MTSTTATTTVHAPRIRPEFRDARRVLTSVLAPIETRCLVWLAHRMPRGINADHLTLLALAAMLGAGASYWLARTSPAGLVLAILCLSVNWFGDSLDGTLARVRDEQRPRYGFYVDHVVDALGATALLTGMGLSGHMSPLVALGLLAAYLLVCVETFLATYSLSTFTMSYCKIGPTELRILLAVGNLAVLLRPAPMIFGHVVRLFDIGGAIGAVGLVAIFLIAATRHTRELYEADPRPQTKSSGDRA